LAAGGALPVDVASAAVAGGRKVLVIGLKGEADERLQAFPYAGVEWGQIGRIVQLMSDHGGREVVFAGTVVRRPNFRAIGSLDMGALRLLPRLVAAMVGGDDTVLGNFLKVIEERGFELVGVADVAPDLVAVAGAVAGPRASAAGLVDAGVALTAARAIGALDSGQAAIVVNQRVVALEAAEGTDSMIKRVGDLVATGRVNWSGRAGVLAKCAKPGQDLRLDMPVIGPRTVELVAEVGLAGVVVEAGRVILAERAQTIAAAERTGTFVIADDGGGPADQ